MNVRLALLLAPLGASFLIACATGLGIDESERPAVLITTNAGSMYALSGAAFDDVERVRAVPPYVWQSVDAPRKAVAVMSGVYSDGVLRSSFLAIDKASGTILQRDYGRSSSESIDGVYGIDALAVTDGGGTVFAYPATRDGQRAVVRFESSSLDTTGFLLLSANAGGLAIVKRGDQELLAVAGTRLSLAQSRTDSLFLVDIETLEAVDSLPLLERNPYLAPVSLWELTDGSLLVTSLNRVLEFDPATRSFPLDRAVDLGIDVFLAELPGGEIAVVDHGSIDFPGHGQLRVFDRSFELQFAVPLAEHGPAPAARLVRASADGTRAYVLTGTAERGAAYGPQRAGLLVVDLVERRVVARTTLPDYGPTSMIVLE